MVVILLIYLFALLCLLCLELCLDAGLFIYWQTRGPRRLRATSLELPEVVRGGP